MLTRLCQPQTAPSSPVLTGQPKDLLPQYCKPEVLPPIGSGGSDASSDESDAWAHLNDAHRISIGSQQFEEPEGDNVQVGSGPSTTAPGPAAQEQSSRTKGPGPIRTRFKAVMSCCTGSKTKPK